MVTGFDVTVDFAKSRVHAAGVDAFLITGVDRFLQPCSRDDDWPIKWLTAFEGSAGSVLLTGSEVFLLTDARYTEVAKTVVPPGVSVIDSHKTSLHDVLRQHLPQSGHLLLDPWRLSAKLYDQITKSVPKVTVQTGEIPLFDKVAALPRKNTPFWLFNALGHHFKESYARVRAHLNDAETFFCGDCVALSWLLNIRQPGVDYVPAARIYGLITAKSIFVWCEMECVSDEVRSALSPLVSFLPLSEFDETFSALIQNVAVTYEPERTPYAVLQLIEKSGRPARPKASPIRPLQIIKTPEALAHLGYAHEREGLAFVRLFYDVETSMAGHGAMTEYEIVKRLEDIRESCARYKGPSFPTIASAGSNGAFVHYRPSPEKTGSLSHGHLFLLDAGGHYLPGATTDTTRTIALGAPHNPKVITYYTAVLKGLIAYTRALFPSGTRGVQLEALARAPLWRMGADYDHATGHGVGSFLNVHEPPTLGARDDGIALAPSMVVTCEPGYYKSGAFGIRLENMMVVVKSAEEGFLTFETLTLVPFDRTLIDCQALDAGEIDWIDRYHERVFDGLSPLLDEASLQDWLYAKTRPLEGP
jgi:Xaa-Pro aminopeptidase